MARLNFGAVQLGMVAIATSFLSACVTTATQSNPVQKVADTMVGKPISVAIKAFGPPTLNLPPCSYCTDGGTYAWNMTKISKNSRLAEVQVGTEYSNKVVGMDRGNPVSQTQATPIYETRVVDGVDFLCNIQAFTDMKDNIKSIEVAGCTADSRY